MSEDESFTETDQDVITSPAIGGPYASGGTTNTGTFITTGAQALPYMDRAASNWGCDWNMGANPVVVLPGGNFSKAYGTRDSTAQGCGIVYWNSAKQSAFFVAVAGGGANVANAKVGATTTTSSTFSAGTPVSAINDGNRRGTGWSSGGGWSSAQPATVAAPQWVAVQFNQQRTINAIEVVTLQDNYGNPIEPTSTMTFASYGIRDYTVEVMVNGIWKTVGSIANNNLVLRRFTFAAETATQVRVKITRAADSYARVVEVSAYDASPAITSPLLGSRYTTLGATTGILGAPVSNPAPYSGNGVTYQLFDNGVMTFKRGGSQAYFVGGTTPANAITGAPAFDDRPLAAAWQARFNAYPTTAGTPIAYALASDAGCAASSSTNPTQCFVKTAGRFAKFSDDYWGGTGYLVAKLGGAGFVITVPFASQLPISYPWSGDLGFPTANVTNAGGGGSYQQQTFEHGLLSWSPGYDTANNRLECPNPIATCTGSSGQSGCPVIYGTRFTNYIVQRGPAPHCATPPIVVDDPLNPYLGIQYYVSPGSYQDFPLGSFPAGTTLELGNCSSSQTGSASLFIYKNGQYLPTPGNCVTGSGAYSTFSSRLGTEQWTFRVSCAGTGGVACTGVLRLETTNDFNGDLISVLHAYEAVPNTTMNASLLGMLDPNGLFTDPYYTCTEKDDHPEGVVRLPDNRFAVTTDFGSDGKLYLFDIASKGTDEAHRLGTNLVGDTVPATDRMVDAALNATIGRGRGHLGGATRSGFYLLTASEDDDESLDGMISVIDTRGDRLDKVNEYLNVVMLGSHDGAAWVTSAKLGTGSPDRGSLAYIPPELQNAHLILSAGSNMDTVNAVYAQKDGGGLSSLLPFGKQWGDNFKHFASVPRPPNLGKDNQASLITQADGQVYLMMLNGNASSSWFDSDYGYSTLFKVSFTCADGSKICFLPTGGEKNQSYREFQTRAGGTGAKYADMVRAAGTWIHATGDWDEALMVYALWPTKVNSRTDDGCLFGGGPWLRMIEY